LGYYFIAYDIVNNRRRAKISRILEKEGTRLQKSLFFVNSSQSQVAGTVKKLSEFLKDEDSLLVTPVCVTCMDKATYHGPGALVSMVA